MAERKKERVQILRQEEIAPGIYSLWIDSRRIAAAAKAGQFISIYSDDGSRMLPLSFSRNRVQYPQNIINRTTKLT